MDDRHESLAPSIADWITSKFELLKTSFSESLLCQTVNLSNVLPSTMDKINPQSSNQATWLNFRILQVGGHFNFAPAQLHNSSTKLYGEMDQKLRAP